MENIIQSVYDKIKVTGNFHSIDKLDIEQRYDFMEFAIKGFENYKFNLLEMANNGVISFEDYNNRDQQPQFKQFENIVKVATIKYRELLDIQKHKNEIPFEIEKWQNQMDLNITIAEKIAEKTVSIINDKSETIENGTKNNYKIIETQQKKDRITFEKHQLEANKINDLNERITFWSEQKKLFLQNRTLQTYKASGFMRLETGLENERFFLDMLIENEIEHLKLCLELETNNIRNSNEHEILDNYGFSVKQRFYLLVKTGLLETGMFKGSEISQGAKHKLLAKILNCDVRTAKGMFNNEISYQMSIDNQKEIEKLYNKITNNKDL